MTWIRTTEQACRGIHLSVDARIRPRTEPAFESPEARACSAVLDSDPSPIEAAARHVPLLASRIGKSRWIDLITGCIPIRRGRDWASKPRGSCKKGIAASAIDH